MIKIANAPCSWGKLEFDLEHKSEVIGFEQVLNEIKDTGYLGTELGDWGYMPTSPELLRKEISQRGLELLGAFVPMALTEDIEDKDMIAPALEVAELMYNSGYKNAFIILSDDNGSNLERTKNAGRITSDMGLSDKKWERYASRTEKIATAVKESFNLRTVFHHHCAGFVETPKEIEKLMNLTNPELLGLCLDTGHYAFGGGNPIEALEKYYDRIWHVHFKDYDPIVAKASAFIKGDYFDALKRGVFCELGKGIIDFTTITSKLKENGYDDWIVVEQDILPGMGDPKISALLNRKFLTKIGL